MTGVQTCALPISTRELCSILNVSRNSVLSAYEELKTEGLVYSIKGQGTFVKEQSSVSIRKAIAELEYRVNPFARSLKTQRSRFVAVLLPDMTAPFYGAVLAALNKVLRPEGYHTLVSCYSSNHGLERDNLQFLLSIGADGLIYTPEDLTAEEFTELTANSGVPIVLLDRSISGVQADTVLVNNTDSVYQAVSRLMEQGHERIGIISGPKSVFTAKERLIGYLRALSDHGVIFDDSLAVSGENTFATGYQGLISLMSQPSPPTAIFSTNYDITVGLITAARERGVKIPDEVSVFGFDCAEICRMMTPPIPVVQQPEQELGRLAGMRLIERMSGSRDPARITRLPCRLIE